jgi:hypothetical protein
MPGVTTLWTRRTTMLTPTITPPSGLSTAESSGRCERLLGELSELLADDPYWGICLKLWRLLSRKRGYYGCKESPLENALGVKEDGIIPWKYQVARVGEKCRRLRGSLRTIDIRDTLMDIAGHAVVAVACLDHEVDHESEDAAVASGSP